LPPKRPGRRPLDPSGGAAVPVHLTLTATMFDELRQRARREGVTVQTMIRRAMREGKQKANTFEK
jgi:hypothetical protein